MHLEGHALSPDYERHVGRKRLFLLGMAGACLLMMVFSVSRGAVSIPVADVVSTLLGGGEAKWRIIVLNIRLPQTLAALIAGGGLSLAGAVMQSALRNPLGSPFTLGLSNAAAFGAAFSIIVLGTGSMQSSA
ncbi:iron chelate uptake ABC transporter family permease subunit, partial [Aminivibrio sp.]|uniref:iron chelate uptake ABC transporter family permease subunit n=1 Tax=Aminivibrio sp. TaxID=1872489 RepID=UPI00345E214F